MQLLLSDKHSTTNEATKQSQLQFVFANPSFVLQSYNEGNRKMNDMSDDVMCLIHADLLETGKAV